MRMTDMKVIFRVDASQKIGIGHVMRCLTLANALCDFGAYCLFVCREHPGNLLELIRQQGFEARGLAMPEAVNFPAQNLMASQLIHADWLGDTWQNDADQTFIALRGEVVDWLVVDHYAIDTRWEAALKPAYRRLLVIDDLADRNHNCDLLLDPNLVAQMTERYCDRAPPNCRRLLGPNFALLQPIYSVLNQRAAPREGKIKHVLVYFGGADNHNLTGKTISAFLALGIEDVYLDVVINPDGQHATDIKRQVQNLGQIQLHTHLPSLSHLMMRADIAVGACGATSWERCCLGLPSLVVTLAENQRAIAAELHERGLVQWLGHVTEINEEQIKQALSQFIAKGVSVNWSRRCREVVDGHGVKRVSGAMLLPFAQKLFARVAIVEDEQPCVELLRAESKSGNFYELYRSWLRDPKSYLPTIIESDSGYLVALVVFDLRNLRVGEIVVIDPFAFKNGLYRLALATALTYFRKVTRGAAIRTPEVSSISELAMGGMSTPLLPGGLSISICSDVDSWINDSIPELILDLMQAGHQVVWVNHANELPGGDLCFLLGYRRIVSFEIRNRYRNCLVIHASELPRGRGWSPASWLILEGAQRIPVTLLEAVDQVDAGPIYCQDFLELDGTELIGDWHTLLADATIKLVKHFSACYPEILHDGRIQSGEPSFYPRRKPKDGEVDPSKSLVEIFNYLRIADNDNYPVYFKYLNTEYFLRINRKG
jgi:UDP-2,4-diacetamido-2,4,6-trideoxy-beta-L-altropyranose hydrolase